MSSVQHLTQVHELTPSDSFFVNVDETQETDKLLRSGKIRTEKVELGLKKKLWQDDCVCVLMGAFVGFNIRSEEMQSVGVTLLEHCALGRRFSSCLPVNSQG